MKRTIWLSICLLMSLATSAQTQQGIVKTRGHDATHPLMVSTYKYLGMIHSKLGNNDSALLYYGKALKGMKDNTQEADEIRKEMEFLK